jgi:hypothetical protein
MDAATLTVTADWASINKKAFADLTEAAFAGNICILPNADVWKELTDGDALTVVADSDCYTAYECGDGGNVLQIAACCNLTNRYVDRDEFAADGFTDADYDTGHECQV